jgi:hypothetical protein
MRSGMSSVTLPEMNFQIFPHRKDLSGDAARGAAARGAPVGGATQTPARFQFACNPLICLDRPRNEFPDISAPKGLRAMRPAPMPTWVVRAREAGRRSDGMSHRPDERKRPAPRSHAAVAPSSPGDCKRSPGPRQSGHGFDSVAARPPAPRRTERRRSARGPPRVRPRDRGGGIGVGRRRSAPVRRPA